MMNTQHTPGPWKVGHEYCNAMDEIESANGNCIAAVWTRRAPRTAEGGPRECYKDDAEGQANARLIAVAPELLEALRGILPVFDNDKGDITTLTKVYADRIAAASAAILKATQPK